MAAQTSPDHDPLTHAFETGYDWARREAAEGQSERRLKLAEATEKRKAGAGRRKAGQHRGKIKRETAGRQAASTIRTQEREAASALRLQELMRAGEIKAKQRAAAKPAPSTGSFFTRRVAWGGSQLAPPGQGEATRRVSGVNISAPTGGSVTATTATFQKATSARLILLSMGVAGAAIIVGSSKFPAYTAQGPNGNVRVPGTLHAFAGLTIAGTIALVVNEVSPDLGIVFAVGMVFIALADVQVFVTLGESLFGKGAKHSAAPKAPSTGGASNLPTTRPPQGGIWEPGGNPGVQPGASPGSGPIEVPYGSPSG